MMEARHVKDVFIYGLMTEVCILQSVVHLLKKGSLNVWVIEDGTSSITEFDREIAFRVWDILQGSILIFLENGDLRS